MAEAEDGFLTLKGLRTATMMHLAMHDALNSVEPAYKQYMFGASAKDADATAAILHAAFVVAIDQYPGSERWPVAIA